mmetsp:Transcript_75808/g.213495  ORF Transcript_75808/g.213495 Transcript_75808/m.213495 type:complete len:217 (+) Transcript_75808:414-1064(+)
MAVVVRAGPRRQRPLTALPRRRAEAPLRRSRPRLLAVRDNGLGIILVRPRPRRVCHAPLGGPRGGGVLGAGAAESLVGGGVVGARAWVQLSGGLHALPRRLSEASRGRDVFARILWLVSTRARVRVVRLALALCRTEDVARPLPELRVRGRRRLCQRLLAVGAGTRRLILRGSARPPAEGELRRCLACGQLREVADRRRALEGHPRRVHQNLGSRN